MKRERKKQAPLILGAVVFLIGGVDALQNQGYLVGISSVLAALLNLVAAGFVLKSPRATTVCLHVLNAVVAGVMVLANVWAGKSYIQYAWAAAVPMFLIAAYRTFRECRPGPSGKDRLVSED